MGNFRVAKLNQLVSPHRYDLSIYLPELESLETTRVLARHQGGPLSLFRLLTHGGSAN